MLLKRKQLNYKQIIFKKININISTSLINTVSFLYKNLFIFIMIRFVPFLNYTFA